MSTEPLQSILDEFGPDPDLPPLDPRLEALVHRELGSADLALLQAEAEQDQSLSQALEAFTPLEMTRAQTFAHQVRDNIKPTTETESTGYGWQRWFALLIAPLAAIVLAVLIPSPPVEYEHAVVAGDVVLRGETLPSPNDLRISEGSTVELLLHPTQVVPSTNSAHLVVKTGSDVYPIEAVVELEQSGSIKITAKMPDLPAKGNITLSWTVENDGHQDTVVERSVVWQP